TRFMGLAVEKSLLAHTPLRSNGFGFRHSSQYEGIYRRQRRTVSDSGQGEAGWHHDSFNAQSICSDITNGLIFHLARVAALVWRSFKAKGLGSSFIAILCLSDMLLPMICLNACFLRGFELFCVCLL